MPKVLNPERILPRPDNPELLESVCESQRLGYSQRVTASRAGIGKATLELWLSKGKAEIDSGEIGSLGLFVGQYESAASDRESILTDAITASVTDKTINFVPALILNKARNPADWLEARQVNIEANVNVTTVHELGSAAQKAIALHMLSLETVEGATDLDTGGTDTPTPPLLPEGRSDSP